MKTSSALLLALTLGPLLLLSLSPTVDAVNRVPVRGPQAGIFHAMAGVVLYGAPLVLAVAALAIHAVREHSAAFAFGAGLLVNFTATVVYLISAAGAGAPIDRVALVTTLQLNAIASASVALIWISTRDWWAHNKNALAGTERVLLVIQAGCAITLNALLIIPVTLYVVAFPEAVGVGTFAVSSFPGWLGVSLTIAAVMVFHKRRLALLNS